VTFTGGADHPTTAEMLIEEAKRNAHRAKHARQHA